MRTPLIVKVPVWGWMLSLLFLLTCTAHPFVELTAQIDSEDWDFRFFCDQAGSYPGNETRPSLFTNSYTVRCVVGTNAWMMESDHFLRNANVTRWFTGTNVVEQWIISRESSAAAVNALSEIGGLAATAPRVGERVTRVYNSSDGNPGRPVRVSDLMELRGRICWLALCSGSFLKGSGRVVFPPSDFWKESALAYSGWTDKTTVFDDSLGLPKSMVLLTTNNQPIFQYQTRGSTNVLGWSFPLEFYGVQYHPNGTSGWKLHQTFKGRLTAINVGATPLIPEEVSRSPANVYDWWEKKYGHLGASTDEILGHVGSEPSHSILSALDYRIRQKAYRQGEQHLTNTEKRLHEIYSLDVEANNRGFEGFFLGSEGRDGEEALADLKEIGATSAAAIPERAMEVFPDGEPPKNKLSRREAVKKTADWTKSVWELCGAEYYHDNNRLRDLVLLYAGRNRAGVVLP